MTDSLEVCCSGIPSKIDKQPAPFFLFPRNSAIHTRYTCNRAPVADRENFHAAFQCLTRSGEDPAVFKCELDSLLAKADPSLAPDTKKALLARQYRQYMKGLLRTLQFKLLEHNPTPTLDEML